MEEILISKKDLLDLTGISYGQLYRWKRKQLIPEDWFVKKSSFTGQETFFPKDKILSRIDRIVNMKDEHSLNDIAEQVSPSPVNVRMTKEELEESRIVSPVSIDIYTKNIGEAAVYDFDRILFIFIFEKGLNSGELSTDEGVKLLQLLENNYHAFEGRNCELIFTRTFGTSSWLLIQSPSQLYFEKSTKIIYRISLASCIEELKIKIS